MAGIRSGYPATSRVRRRSGVVVTAAAAAVAATRAIRRPRCLIRTRGYRILSPSDIYWLALGAALYGAALGTAVFWLWHRHMTRHLRAQVARLEVLLDIVNGINQAQASRSAWEPPTGVLPFRRFPAP